MNPWQYLFKYFPVRFDVCIVTIVFSLLYGVDVSATPGKNFVVTWPLLEEVAGASDIQKYIIITSPKTVSVNLNGSTMSVSGGGGMFIMSSAPGFVRGDLTSFTGDGLTKTNMVTTISSSDTISVLAMVGGTSAKGYYTVDIVNLLPTTVLDSGYILQTYKGQHSNFMVLPSNNTPSLKMWQYYKDDDNQASLVGVSGAASFTRNISPGSSAYFNYSQNMGENDSKFQLSGTRVSSDVPIAVFQSTPRVFIPTGNLYGDMAWEQAYPISTMGKEYVVVRASPIEDRVLITALQDGTQVSIVGSSPVSKTLSAFETYEYVLTTHSCHISSNKIISCSRYTTASTKNSNTGDPSASYIPPVTQMYEGSVSAFLGDNSSTSSSMSTVNDVYVTLLVPADAISTMFKGSVNIGDHFAPVNGTDKYYYYTEHITSASGYATYSNVKGFMGWVSGFSHFTSSTAAAAFTYLLAADIKKENALIINSDGDIVPGGDTIDLSLHGCDVLELEGVVYSSSQDGVIIKSDEGIKRYTITIDPSVSHTPDEDSICTGDNYMWREKVYSKPGIYTDQVMLSTGCIETFMLVLVKKSDCPEDEEEEESLTNFECLGVESYREIRKAKSTNMDNKSLVKENKY